MIIVSPLLPKTKNPTIRTFDKRFGTNEQVFADTCAELDQHACRIFYYNNYTSLETHHSYPDPLSKHPPKKK